jgi:hypothetical protein
MKIKVVVVALLVVILLLLISRSNSTYTSQQLTAGVAIIPSPIKNDAQIIQNLYDAIIKSIKGEPILQVINNIITMSNAKGLNVTLVPYATEEAITNMFRTAYLNGESGLTNTDKFLLRLYSFIGFDLATQLTGGGIPGAPTLEYDSQGKPIWTDETIAPLGLSVNQSIQKVFELAKKFAPGSGLTPDDFILEINKILPPTYTKFSTGAGFLQRTSTDPSIIWLFKFISIGPLYILWVAENKWRLDTTWRVTVNVSPGDWVKVT